MSSSTRQIAGSKTKYGMLLALGTISGLIASLAVSSMILLAERVAQLPVGTFYLVLYSAITQEADYRIHVVVQGFLLHLVAGAFIGLVLSVPFVTRRGYSVLSRFAPGLGLMAGLVIWVALFVPISFVVMIPLLQSLDGQSVISQQPPVGTLFEIAVGDLLLMIDRVLYTALAFNLFFGLVTLILIRSFADMLIGRKKLVL